MYRVRVQATRNLRYGLLGCAAVSVFLSCGLDPADARFRRHHEDGYQPPYASIVIDGNSGQVLHTANPDNLRHPASLTKIMTLYLLFEQLEAGKIKLDTRMPVSARAASQSPTKLGLEPGQSIDVDSAIKAVVTKSANDAAVVIAEAIGGDEDKFAQTMTRKARALGMTRTVYANASGLPNDEQVTTARDQALLGRAIQDRFPKYYRYFSTESFQYRGVAMRNHNHLLGRVAGVDGIKTGYTQASGFNLVSSVHRGNRYIIGVVLGGTSGSSRDARMRQLIETHIAEASPRRTAPLIAENLPPEPAPPKSKVASAPASKSETAQGGSRGRADASPTATIPTSSAANTVPTTPRAGSNEAIQPVLVKTIIVKSGSIQTAAIAPLVTPTPQSSVAPANWTSAPASSVPQQAESVEAPAPPQLAPDAAPPGNRPGVLGVLPARPSAAAPTVEVAAAPAVQVASPTPAAASLPVSSQPAMTSAQPAPSSPQPPLPATQTPPSPTSNVEAASSPSNAAPAVSLSAQPARVTHHGEWMIQVGAFPDEGQAKQRLVKAQHMAQGLLGKADPFTERIVKGSTELYRARFAGLDKDRAEAACRYFKKNEIACMPLKN
jgi:D-alanyl-D-alanine carboxypeptidase